MRAGQSWKIFAAFAENGPTAQELENAKKQIETDLDESMREPSYWLSVLSDLDYHGKSLEDEKAEPTAYRPYQIEDLVKVFRKYHTPPRQFQTIAAPAVTATEEEERQEPAATTAP